MGLKFTKAQLTKQTKPELLKLADQEGFDVEDEDLTKADIIATLLEVEESDDVEEEDDEEVEEVDDEEEEDDEPELPEEDEIDDAPPAPAKSKAKAKQTKYTESGTNADGEKLLGAKEVAAQLNTDAKTLRQFFRSGKSSFNAVGAGGRYEFAEGDVTKIKTEFDAWKAGKPGRGAKAEGGTTTRSRGKKPAPAAAVLAEVEEIDDEELDDEIDDEDLELED